ncbi:MAG TPA: hypothetical protein VHS57_09730 [Acidimicrobiales bacterium]|nr:hypothetical protein [Acidimicrobiales bacterium]
MREHRLIDAAFGLYPRWWRDRYLDEVHRITEDLVAGGRSRWALAGNLAVGAVRARVRGAGMPASYDLWARRSAAVVALATAPGLVAIALVASIRQAPLRPSQVAATTPAATAAYLVLLLSSVLLVGVMISAYRTIARGVRERGPSNRRGLRILARAPGWLALASAALLVASLFLRPGGGTSTHGHVTLSNGHPLLAAVLLDAAGIAVLLCGAAVSLLLVEVARHAALSLRTLTSGLYTARALMALLWLMTFAAATLSALSQSGVTSLAGVHLTAFPTGASLLGMALLLGALATVATFGVALAGQSLRVTRSLAA